MFKWFGSLRLLKQIVIELGRIATVLEYFAAKDARLTGSMFMPRARGWAKGRDESELTYTDSAAIQAKLADEEALMLQQGFPALDKLDEFEE